METSSKLEMNLVSMFSLQRFVLTL